jgi:hypothetical protein
MPIANILSEIDAEISLLLKVKELLSGTDSLEVVWRRRRVPPRYHSLQPLSLSARCRRPVALGLPQR